MKNFLVCAYVIGVLTTFIAGLGFDAILNYSERIAKINALNKGCNGFIVNSR